MAYTLGKDIVSVGDAGRYIAQKGTRRFFKKDPVKATQRIFRALLRAIAEGQILVVVQGSTVTDATLLWAPQTFTWAARCWPDLRREKGLPRLRVGESLPFWISPGIKRRYLMLGGAAGRSVARDGYTLGPHPQKHELDDGTLVDVGQNHAYALLVSPAFRRAGEALFRDDATAAPDRLNRIFDLLAGHELLKPDRIRSDKAERKAAAADLRRVTFAVVERYQAEALIVSRRQFKFSLKLGQLARMIEHGTDPTVDPHNVGRRGGAGKSRKRALLIRELGIAIPPSVPQRAAIITGLLTAAGIPTSRQLVTSTFKHG